MSHSGVIRHRQRYLREDVIKQHDSSLAILDKTAFVPQVAQNEPALLEKFYQPYDESVSVNWLATINPMRHWTL